MFLTQFRINTARVEARRLLSSPHRLHGAVTASFGESAARGADEPRVLWRLDETTDRGMLLYIVSPQRPDLTHLVEQAGWPTTGGWRTYDYAPFLDRIKPGGVWDFRLTANPTHSIRRTPDEPWKRTAHVAPRYQAQWLIDHQEQGGFVVEEKPAERRRLPEDVYQLTVHGQRDLRFSKRAGTPAGGRAVSVLSITFDGRLRVTDAKAMRHTLTAGLGRAKAYGCGLMTLATPM